MLAQSGSVSFSSNMKDSGCVMIVLMLVTAKTAHEGVSARFAYKWSLRIRHHYGSFFVLTTFASVTNGDQP